MPENRPETLHLKIEIAACLVGIALVSLPISAARAAGDSRQMLLSACDKKMKETQKVEAKRRLTCTCIAENLEAKLTANEFSLIAKNYADDPGAAKTLRQAKYSPAVDFDLETAALCLENPSWRVNAKTQRPSPSK